MSHQGLCILQDVTPTQVSILDLIAKGVGVKASVSNGLKGNAEIDHKTGEVAIDFNFERVIRTGAKEQNVSIVFHAAHEMALHRVVELAPEEGKAFVYAMYRHLSGNESSRFTLADQKRIDYSEQGVELSLAQAMEEISANNILYLYNNDETKFQEAIDRIVNGTDVKAKNGLQKYLDYLRKIIRKIRNFITGKSGSERVKLQAELDEITRLRDMFETAFANAVERTKALQSENSAVNSDKTLETETNKEYNGNVNYTLKSNYNEYNTLGMQWAYDIDTQIGDLNLLYDAHTGGYVLVEATKEGVGFIELKTGRYQQLRKDLEVYESRKQRVVNRKSHRIGNGQNNYTRNNVNVGNRGTGKQNVKVSPKQSVSNKATNTQTTKGNLNQGKKNFSLKWHTDLTRTQLAEVEKRLSKIVNHEEKRITDTASWYSGRLNGDGLFVIYSTEYPSNPTILYEVKGAKANIEKAILLDLLEDESNGKNFNGKPSFTQRISQGNWMSNVHGGQYNFQHLGGGTNNQNVGILQGQPRGNGSPAFRNVLENLFGKQEERLNQGKSHSLKEKDAQYLELAKDPEGRTDGELSDKSHSLKGINHVTKKEWSGFVDAFEDVQNGKKGASERLAKYVDSGMISTEVYTELVKTYGAIPAGENPSRDITVPKKTANNKKVSQTVRTILEAKVTPDEVLPTIEKMVEDGVFSYETYTDKQAIADAEDYIKEYGWDESLADWFDDVEKGVVSKQHTAMGWALYNNAVNTAMETADAKVLYDTVQLDVAEQSVEFFRNNLLE